ncbi:uncharacterized protein C8Q71DRAFT_515978 [Rhodofomes roseus]|uniref:Uncharacterized protein n=1 Tax=Rhodofomes roseus TaxID=34475 RepID=A0ABQ8KN82_9APHY|nr:uncharacterized protein C8Q71DRAFT_515978 [Rhodofomes roseus]KAH9839518.1 hypothetical protein C8Q71DRAFT_515978 [Rhodofomes roseus]
MRHSIYDAGVRLHGRSVFSRHHDVPKRRLVVKRQHATMLRRVVVNRDCLRDILLFQSLLTPLRDRQMSSVSRHPCKPTEVQNMRGCVHVGTFAPHIYGATRVMLTATEGFDNTCRCNMSGMPGPEQNFVAVFRGLWYAPFFLVLNEIRSRVPDGEVEPTPTTCVHLAHPSLDRLRSVLRMSSAVVNEPLGTFVTPSKRSQCHNASFVTE